LNNIRLNSTLLAKEHKRQYFHLKYILQFFRLPVIFLSALNSIISVGMQDFVSQKKVSIITCLLALTCSIIGSIELYLAIQKRMENEMTSYQEYYLLSIDIYKNLSLAKRHRAIPAKEYLERVFNEYRNLVESSNILSKKMIDQLTPVDGIVFSVKEEEDLVKDIEILDVD